MKKTLTTIACSMIAVGAFAQGQVFMINNNQINDSTGAAAGPASGGNFEVELVVGTSATTVNQAVPSSINPLNAGFFNGPPASSGIVTLDGTGGNPTIAANLPIFYQVEAWNATSANLTYAQAVAAHDANGISAVNSYTTGGGSPPTPAAPLGFATFALSPVPEPTTLALGAMGLGALFLRRRK